MYQIGSEMAGKPKIKLPTFVGSWKKQGNSKKISSFASLTSLTSLTVWITKKLWKILREMGVLDHFTCLLRNMNEDKEATIRNRHEATDWFKIGKGVRQGCVV